MAAVNVKGVVKTAIDAGGLGNKLGRGLIDGRVKVMLDSYTPDGTEGVGSTIKVGGTLPADASVVGVHISNLAQDAGVTLQVGDSNDDDRYIAAYAADTVLSNDNILQTGLGYVIGTNSGDNQVVIKTAGATLGVGDKIAIAIFYTQD